MAKKHYCQKCQNLIEEGKEIKVHKGGNYSSSRYSSGYGNWYTYYLCSKCFQQEREEVQTRKEKVWKQVGWSLLIIMLVLILTVIFFFIYQNRQDKKIDKITKGVQKK